MLQHHSLKFIVSIMVFLVVLIFGGSVIYSPIVTASQLVLVAEDFDSPEITHDPITKTLQPGDVQPITAMATDSAGVKSLVLFYRPVGEEVYQQEVMKLMDESGQFSITLDTQYYQPPGIEYYFQATDTSGNGSLHGHAYSPLTIAIAIAEADALPAHSTSDPLSTAETMAGALGSTASTSSSKKWLWIGLGVLAAGAIASNKDKKSSQSSTSTLVIDMPTPATSGN